MAAPQAMAEEVAAARESEAEVEMGVRYKEVLKEDVVHAGGERMTTTDKGLRGTGTGQIKSEGMKADVQISSSDDGGKSEEDEKKGSDAADQSKREI